jgi:hypothetical protein
VPVILISPAARSPFSKMVMTSARILKNRHVFLPMRFNARRGIAERA